jgi:hypothetical protein
VAVSLILVSKAHVIGELKSPKTRLFESYLIQRRDYGEIDDSKVDTSKNLYLYHYSRYCFVSNNGFSVTFGIHAADLLIQINRYISGQLKYIPVYRLKIYRNRRHESKATNSFS